VQPFAREPAAIPLAHEPLRWLVERLVGELERSPVHGYKMPRAEIDEGLYRLLRVHVLLLHEPGGIVGADRQQRGVDAREAGADLRESLEVRGIAGMVDARARPFDDETAPQRLVDVEQAAATPMRSEERRVGKECRCRW